MTEDLPDHSNYSVLKAQDKDGNWLTVLLDASGAMVGVMKGDYAGALKTLAVDTKGRIQAVLTDPEDVFGNPNYIGAGELAARLGSIKTFEKRGEVVYMDDFEASTFKWGKHYQGINAAVVRSNASAKSGNYSVKLTTGDLIDDHADMYLYFARPVYKRVGAEISFTLSENTKNFRVWLYVETGTHRIDAGILYDLPNEKIQYLETPGNYVDLKTGVALTSNNKVYNTLKFVVDYKTQKYDHVILNEIKEDMSSFDLGVSEHPGYSHIVAYIKHVTNTNSNEYIYVDNFILTQNEP